MKLFSASLRLPHLWRRVLVVITAALLLFLVNAERSEAHPLGNFSINHYSLIEVGNESLELTYVMDMAEIPTLQTRNEQIDQDQDGNLSAAEQRQYLERQAASLQGNLSLIVNGSEQSLIAQRSEMLFEPAAGGLETLRLTLWLSAPLAEAEQWDIVYRNDNDLDRLGWKEIVVRGSAADLLSASVPESDLSQMLRSYPEDLLYQPLDVTEASFSAQPTGGVGTSRATAQSAATSALPGGEEDGFAALLERETSTMSGLLLVLLAAFLWGAAHAMTPGHGKTVVAAYLVGTRGTARHALFLGLTTTITHTAGVFALGLATLFLSRYILPEQLYPWLSVLSGLLVLAIGLFMIRERYQAYRYAQAHRHAHEHGLDHEHSHEHDPHHHGHDHHHHPGHGHDHGHSHLPPGAEGEPIGWRSLLALGVSGGLVPCPSALVVLLGAVALGRVGFGLLLITVFSIGLAGVLTGIGLLMVRARTLFNHIPAGGPLLRAIPVGSAIIITLIGLGISWQALNQVGLFSDLAVLFWP